MIDICNFIPHFNGHVIAYIRTGIEVHSYPTRQIKWKELSWVYITMYDYNWMERVLMLFWKLRVSMSLIKNWSGLW